MVVLCGSAVISYLDRTIVEDYECMNRDLLFVTFRLCQSQEHGLLLRRR